jgi:hypothetical protein
VFANSRIPFRAITAALSLAACGGAFAQAIEIRVTAPNRDDNIVYQRIGPSEVGGPYQARVVLRMGLKNITPQPVKITRVEILGQVASNFVAPVEVVPGEEFLFINCRCNQEEDEGGDPDVAESFPIVIDAPAPASAEIKVFLQGVRTPISKVIPLSSFTNDGGPMFFPGKVADLRPNEAWQTSSNHLGGSQIHGLDVSMAGWNPSKNKYDAFYTGADGTKATQHRAYGQPLYAMASGTVCTALNDQPEWKNYPRVDKEIEPEQPAPSTGVYSAGGNHLKIRSGGEVALYGHLQTGSIPPELLVPGATVVKGQYLGKVGYSGRSSGPHIHIDVSQEGSTPCTKNDNRARPMQFSQVQSLTLAEANVLSAADDMDPLDWADLTNHSAPHSWSLLYPTTSNFAFDKDASDGKQYLGVWRAGSHIEVRVNVSGWSAMVAKRNDMAQSGFRLVEINTHVENGKRQFVALFKYGGDAANQGLSLLNGWTEFTAHRDQLAAQGLRLVDVAHFNDGVADNFIGVFLPGTGTQQTINTSSWNSFVGVSESFEAQGLRLVDIETYLNGQGVRQYVGVFRPGTGNQQLIRSASWTQFKIDWAAQSAGGLRLIDVETLVVDGVYQFIGAFNQGGGGYAMELHNGYEDFFQASERNNSKGLRLVDIHVLP